VGVVEESKQQDELRVAVVDSACELETRPRDGLPVLLSMDVRFGTA